MVGPITQRDRDTANRRLKLGFVTLVAGSAGLITLSVDPTPLQFVGALASGALVSILLLRYVIGILDQLRERA
ncbi:MAG: hypothetical protein A07HR60_02768 [uncultured archaeon A07HR60]|jgi:hypothetical protein|nr:MAG: hypothetical protein A07HR60_02768 [uncultured archaeon A07HR60]